MFIICLQLLLYIQQQYIDADPQKLSPISIHIYIYSYICSHVYIMSAYEVYYIKYVLYIIHAVSLFECTVHT